MVGLNLQIMRYLWIKGKEVIFGRGLCVLKTLLEIRNKGVYVSELIKKRRYLNMGFHGYGINEYFSKICFGDMGCLGGEWYETEFILLLLRNLIII